MYFFIFSVLYMLITVSSVFFIRTSTFSYQFSYLHYYTPSQKDWSRVNNVNLENINHIVTAYKRTWGTRVGIEGRIQIQYQIAVVNVRPQGCFFGCTKHLFCAYFAKNSFHFQTCDKNYFKWNFKYFRCTFWYTFCQKSIGNWSFKKPV